MLKGHRSKRDGKSAGGSYCTYDVEKAVHPIFISVLQYKPAKFIKGKFHEKGYSGPQRYISDLPESRGMEWKESEKKQCDCRKVNKGIKDVDDDMGFRVKVRVILPEHFFPGQVVIQQVTDNDIKNSEMIFLPFTPVSFYCSKQN
nr:hypothetical protein [Bacillus sp. SG-1]